MERGQDKKNERIAFLVSVGLHAGLFLTFFFLISWRAPYPPAPEYGVVLNYGLDNQGGGDIQPESPVGNSQLEDKNPEPRADEKNQKDVTKDAEVKEQLKEDKTEATLSDEESPVTVKTEKKKIEDKPKEKVNKVEPGETKSLSEEKPVVKKEAIYPSNAGAKKGETTQSQGDDPGKVGDKGNPAGKLDAKALYGNPGGGGGGNGFGLFGMSGWEWASKPKTPDLPDNEDGRIVFEIECDANGDITSIKTIDRGLSLKAEQLLKEEIQKNSLIHKSSGNIPAKSKGQVVFVLKTK
jgi:protein TonB